MDPPGTRAMMTYIPPHNTWQMTLIWPIDCPVPEQRSLEYHYTKPGRWTYFGQCPPQVLEQRWTCIQIHKTWQMNLLCQMDSHSPWVPEKRWLEYHYTKLGRQTYFGWWTTQVPEQWWLAYHCTKLGRWTYFGQWTPSSLGPEKRCLGYHYTHFSRQTYFGQWTPLIQEQRWLAYKYTKHGRWTYFGQWIPIPPGYQRRDALKTTIQT